MLSADWNLLPPPQAKLKEQELRYLFCFMWDGHDSNALWNIFALIVHNDRKFLRRKNSAPSPQAHNSWSLPLLFNFQDC